MSIFDNPNFSSNGNVIMACHITGVYDVNRNETLHDDSYELVRAWAESIADKKLHGIIFHNNFSVETCRKYENDHISLSASITIQHSIRTYFAILFTVIFWRKIWAFLLIFS